MQLTALKLGSGDLLQVTDHLKIEIFETVKYCGGVFEAYAGNVGGGDICLRYCELLCRYFDDGCCCRRRRRRRRGREERDESREQSTGLKSFDIVSFDIFSFDIFLVLIF